MAYTKPQKMSERKSRKNTSSMALAAVALQDHMAHSLSLHDPLKKKKINHSLPVKNSRNLTSKEKCSRKDEDQKKEYVLDPKPAPLTLAQKLGLVEAPEVLLSDKEWKEVKEKSNARQDSSQPCVICKEDFGLQQQVLLSCSHVFHRTCL